jgi:uncharacterized protein
MVAFCSMGMSISSRFVRIRSEKRKGRCDVATSTKYAHGVFSWVQLGTPDPAAAKRFYGGLFGWKFDDMPAGPEMTYTFITLKDRSVGGLYALSKEMLSQGVPPHWLPFINVTSADDIAKKTSQAGGKVPNAPVDVLDVGRMAVLQDPTGANVAIWQAKTHPGADAINETGAIGRFAVCQDGQGAVFALFTPLPR